MDRSAGIALVKFIEGDPKILCLRVFSSFDLPKGAIEPGETDKEAAIRETAEEAGLTDISFPWGNVSTVVQSFGKKKKDVVVFIGTTAQEPKILKNPVTGKFEHHGFKWLSFDEAEEKLHPYLKPIISWVKTIIT